jgi:hypothetical protein
MKKLVHEYFNDLKLIFSAFFIMSGPIATWKAR